ncbi:serine/threonine-protein kinase [Streptomyces filamentosus]|uniref:serine/threonine-protein kinase n=1 Tax=Streptomyces filamentosus TaxID=67294 RepID=UPI00123B0DF5|nr:serine/threonine-protein kinase [Streptomyces filamentosus]KAA6210982.1 serine/threonine protein kinase [Streptomyces filamentosus]
MISGERDVKALGVLDDRYELRRRLGAGSMGQVWQAYDRELRRPVAVKLIHPHHLLATGDGALADELVERFRREARLVAGFRHPGLPALYDARLGRDAEHVYMVMELVLGRTLESLLRDEPPPTEAQVVDIALQLCGILAHTHAVPVVHRDLKPANIMVSPTGRVTVLDFGVAATFNGVSRTLRRLTRDSQVLGTVGYLAPEQIVQAGLVVPQTDLYAMGCVLYELLTGEPPFTTELNALLHHPPVPLSMLRPGVHPVLEAVVTELLAKRQHERPPSAQDVRDRLLPLRPGAEPVAAPVTPTGPVPAPVPERFGHAQALFDEGHLGQALPAYTALAEELGGAGPRHADQAAQCRARAAHCRMGLGHLQEAYEQFRGLIDDLVPARPPDDPLLLEARTQAGALLVNLGDYGAAMAELADLHRLLVSLPGERHRRELRLVSRNLDRIRRDYAG